MLLIFYSLRHHRQYTCQCWRQWFTPRTDQRFPLHDLDISRQTYSRLVWSTVIVHVAGRDTYSLHDLQHLLVGSVRRRACTNPYIGKWGSRWSRSWYIWSIGPRCAGYRSFSCRLRARHRFSIRQYTAKEVDGEKNNSRHHKYRNIQLLGEIRAYLGGHQSQTITFGNSC